jgi:hypothetical protein
MELGSQLSTSNNCGKNHSRFLYRLLVVHSVYVTVVQYYHGSIFFGHCPLS